MSDEKAREFCIGYPDGENPEIVDNDLSGGFRVIEYSAYAKLEAENKILSERYGTDIRSCACAKYAEQIIQLQAKNEKLKADWLGLNKYAIKCDQENKRLRTIREASNDIEEIQEHYRIFGYEKQSYLKQLLGEIFGCEFKIFEGDEK